MSKHRKDLVLKIVATDNIFFQVSHKGVDKWQGKCIFCNKKLLVSLDGETSKNVTIEHILPRSMGGADDLNNIALACKLCNWEKGRRHDKKKSDKIRSLEVIEKLLKKRKSRWRKNE